MSLKKILPVNLKTQLDEVIETEGDRLRPHNLSFKLRYSHFFVNKVLDGAAANKVGEMIVLGMMLCMETYVEKNQELGVRLLKHLSETSDYAAYQLSFVYFAMGEKDLELEVIDGLVEKRYSPATRRKAELASNLHSDQFDKNVYLTYLKKSSQQGNLRAKMTILMFHLKRGNFLNRCLSLIKIPLVYIQFMLVLVRNNQDERLI